MLLLLLLGLSPSYALLLTPTAPLAPRCAAAAQSTDASRAPPPAAKVFDWKVRGPDVVVARCGSL